MGREHVGREGAEQGHEGDRLQQTHCLWVLWLEVCGQYGGGAGPVSRIDRPQTRKNGRILQPGKER